MALATLYNVPWNENDFNVFSFANRDEHTKIALAIRSKYNYAVPYFVLDPLPLSDMGAWLAQHQRLHNLMNQITKQDSNDLTTVDLTDDSQRTEWIWLHAQEHFKVARALELT